MARQKAPCRAYATPAGCPYGSRCHFSHDNSIRPNTSALAAANNAAIADRPKQATAVGRCHSWWSSGECKHGKKCRYEHIDNPNLKTQVEIRRGIERGGSEVKATQPFPSLGCLDDLSSDALLVPFRYQSAATVNTFLRNIKNTKSITRVEQAEELLVAILSSSHQNDKWVRLTLPSEKSWLTSTVNGPEAKTPDHPALATVSLSRRVEPSTDIYRTTTF